MTMSAATAATLLLRPSSGTHCLATSSSAAHGRSRLLPIRCQSPGVDRTKSKRNLFDNASNLLTNLLAGGNLKNMPVAEGAVTDLFDRPLFCSLYDWFLEICLG